MDCKAFWAFLITSFMLSAFGIRSVSSAYMKIFSHKPDEYTTTRLFISFNVLQELGMNYSFQKFTWQANLRYWPPATWFSTV